MRKSQSAQSISASRSAALAPIHPSRGSGRKTAVCASFLRTTLRQAQENTASSDLVTSTSSSTSPSLPIHPASVNDLGVSVVARAQEMILNSGREPAEPHFGLRGIERLMDTIREQIQRQLATSYALPSEMPSLVDLQTSLQSSIMALVASLPSPPSLTLPDSEAIGSKLILTTEATSAAAWAVVRQQLESFTNSGGSHGGSGGAHDLMVLAIITPAVLAAIAASLPTPEGLKAGGYPNDNGPDENDPEDRLSTNYSAEEVAEYFRKRPLKVAARAAQVAAEMAAFGASLSIDFATGNVDKNEAARADQLRGAIERLGPAFIKIAQVSPP